MLFEKNNYIDVNKIELNFCFEFSRITLSDNIFLTGTEPISDFHDIDNIIESSELESFALQIAKGMVSFSCYCLAILMN